MAISVTKLNTKLYKSADGGWVQVVHDTGQVDAEGNAVTVEATLTMAAVELQEGVPLPKARIKAILEEALGQRAAPQAQELAAL